MWVLDLFEYLIAKLYFNSLLKGPKNKICNITWMYRFLAVNY